jgi:mRNA interferase RelE/StbE
LAGARYDAQLKPAAERDLTKIADQAARRRIASAIDNLATNPRPMGAHKLAGENSIYRIRVGDYRILYAIEDRQLLVLVIRVGHRREVYR